MDIIFEVYGLLDYLLDYDRAIKLIIEIRSYNSLQLSYILCFSLKSRYRQHLSKRVSGAPGTILTTFSQLNDI